MPQVLDSEAKLSLGSKQFQRDQRLSLTTVQAQDATLRVAAAETIDEIGETLAEIAEAYRFSAFAGGIVTGPIAHSSQPFFFSNWSDYWIFSMQGTAWTLTGDSTFASSGDAEAARFPRALRGGPSPRRNP
jgi:hypothetical protein